MQAYETRSNSSPRIGYHQALSKCFCYQGITYSVESCPPDVLLAFLASCPLPVKQKNKLAWYQMQRDEILQELAGECDTLARWYAIDSLLLAKIPIPFSS